MKKKERDLILGAAFAAITLAIIVFSLLDYKNCKGMGGDYVRGLAWFECIGGKDE